MAFDLGAALNYLDGPGWGSTRTQYESTPSYQYQQARALQVPGQSLRAVYNTPPVAHVGWAHSGGSSGLPAPVAQPMTAPERFAVDVPFSSTPRPESLPPPVAKTYRAGVGPGQGNIVLGPLNLGALTNAIGDTVNSALNGGLNLGNVVPWLAQNSENLAHAVGDQILSSEQQRRQLATMKEAGGTEAAKALALERQRDVWALPVQFLNEGMEALASVAAPVLNTVTGHDWYRDSQLGDRAKLYAAIVSGRPLTNTGPLSGDILSGLGSAFGFLTGIGGRPQAQNLPALSASRVLGPSVEAEWRDAGAAKRADEWNKLVEAIAASGGRIDRSQLGQTGIDDPALWSAIGTSGKLSREDVARIIAGAIDLPDGVKAAIAADPSMAARGLQGAPGEETPLGKVLDANGGRQWSYQPGNEIRSAMLDIGFQLPALIGLIGGAGALSSGLRAGLEAGEATPTSTAALRALGVAQKATSTAAKIQRGLFVTGAAATGVTGMAQVVARYLGDENAVRWLDDAWRTHPLSDDPNVVLVSMLTVNPLQGIGALRKGVFHLAGEAAGTVFDKATAGRFTHLYTNQEYLYERTGQMFGAKSGRAAVAFTKAHLLGPGKFSSDSEMADSLVGTAADILLDPRNGRLPRSEIAYLGSLDPVERTKTVLAKYPQQIMDIIAKEPKALAQRFTDRSWNYHGYAGTFEPNLALRNFLDYRDAQRLTLSLRQRIKGSVLGYVEQLPPAETARLRQTFAERFPDPNEQVSVAELNDLIRARPALRHTYQDLPAVREKGRGIVSVPRSTIDTMLDRADIRFRTLQRTNPVKAATGREPILRPGYSDAELADALQTTPAVLEEIKAHEPGMAVSNDLRAFLRDRTGADTATMSGDDVANAAVAYVGERSAQWVKAGKAIETLQRLQTQAEQRFAEYQAAGDTGSANVAAEEVQRVSALLADAQSQVPNTTTFARRLSGIERSTAPEVDIEVMEQAKRAAMSRAAAARIQEIELEFETRLGSDFVGAASWEKRAGTDQYYWTAGLGQVPAGIRRKAMSEMTRRGRAAETEEFSDGEIWTWLRQNPDWVKDRLTKTQRTAVNERLKFRVQRISRPDSASADVTDENLRSFGALNEYLNDRLSEIDELTNLQFRTRGSDRAKGLDEELVSRLTERALESRGPGGALNVRLMFADEDAMTGLRHDELVAQARELAAAGDAEGALDRVFQDPLMANRLDVIKRSTNLDEAQIVADPEYARELFPVEQLGPPEETAVDAAIRQRNGSAINQALDRLAAERPIEPIANVPRDLAEDVAKAKVIPTWMAYPRQFAEHNVALDAVPNTTVADPLGLEVLSVINHGVLGTTPRSLREVVAILHDLQDGTAEKMGVGLEMRAKAQAAAQAMLDDALKFAKREAFPTVQMVDPARWDSELLNAAKEQLGRRMVMFDRNDPLGLTYGLKQQPKVSAPLEFPAVPGLAEELFTGHFEPYTVRAEGAQLRHAFGWLFGPVANREIGAAAKREFANRLSTAGVDPSMANEIWSDWHDFARASRSKRITTDESRRLRVIAGDNPLYADVRNIPNASLLELAQGTVRRIYEGRPGAIPEEYLKVNYADALREATSGVRRAMMDHAPSLGDAIAWAYNHTIHHSFATTYYYWFRFGLDVRFHAMNSFEGAFLYAGRAALEPGVANNRTWLGYTANHLRDVFGDQLADMTYPFTTSRFDWAYRMFVRKQGGKLADALEAMERSDPSLLNDAAMEMARVDPELSKTIAAFGDTPEGWLQKLDAWHAKVLSSRDPEAAITGAFAKASADEPALAEIYGRMQQANLELWNDIRGTFFGNAERSRAERVLNSWLLFWPLSYQLKAGKWLAQVLFDGVGGLPVNAYGAYALDHLQAAHDQMLAENPAYRSDLAALNYLSFTLAMMFPITTSAGVTLSPLLDDVVFGRHRGVLDIGPVYTISTLAPNVAGELYQKLRDVPAVGILSKILASGLGIDTARLDRSMPPPPGPLDAASR